MGGPRQIADPLPFRTQALASSNLSSRKDQIKTLTVSVRAAPLRAMWVIVFVIMMWPSW